MDDTVIDLVALAQPLKAVRFPNGTLHTPRAADAIAFRMRDDASALEDDQARGKRGLELLQYLYPSAQLVDIASLGREDPELLVKHAFRQADLALTLVGNSGAGTPQTENGSQPSTPSTTPSTSSVESGESPAAVPSTT